MTGARTLRILPDGERVETALVEAASSGAGFVAAGAYWTLSELLERLGGARFLRRRPCTPLTARIVAWSCARDLGTGPFGSFVHEPSFARHAFELFSELKRGGLGPPGFEAAVSSIPTSRRERAQYLAKLYAKYTAKMAELELADGEDLVRGGILALRERGLPTEMAAFNSIEVAWLHDFPPARLELLATLGEHCDTAGKAFRLLVPGGGSAYLDAAVDDALGAFERRFRDSTRVELGKLDLDPTRHPFEVSGKKLFAPDVPLGQLRELGPRLALRCARNAREEARFAARRAMQLLRTGTPPEEIAIAYRDLGEEAEWLAEALEDLGVPAKVRRGAPLSSTAVGRLALSLPLMVEDGFPAEEVARVLSSRYAPAVSGGAPDSPLALLRLASVRDDGLGAAGGEGAYRIRLSALAERLAARNATGRAELVRALLERCERLIAIGRRLPDEAKASELLDGWWRCLGDLGVPRAIRQQEPRAWEATAFGRAVVRALARDQAAFESLHTLVSELDSAFRMTGVGAQQMSRRAFHRWLTDAAADFNLPARGPRTAAVAVLDVRELPGRSFEHVILCGMVDGRMPGRPAPHPLFPEEDRAQVNRHHKRDVFRWASGEPGGRAPFRLAEDRLLLYCALSSARSSVTLSYAREASGGREQIASPFLDEVSRLFARPIEPLPARAVQRIVDVETEQELREASALEALAVPELRSSEPDGYRGHILEQMSFEPWFQEAQELGSIEEERLRYFGQPDAKEGAYTGRVPKALLQEALDRTFRFGSERPLSASALGRFGNCAYQGFLAHALRLEEPELPGEEIDARGRGSFWHEVLEHLFPRLVREGLLGKPSGEVPQELIDDALETAAKTAEERTHTGHPALWKIGREQARQMVRGLLDSDERGLPFGGMVPTRTELRFGRADAPEGWREVVLPGVGNEPPIHLEGKIDRVDEGPGGIGLLDYKSKKLKTASKLYDDLLTTEFQLALYLHAAQSGGRAGRMGAAWLSLKTGVAVTLDQVLAEGGETLREVLATDEATRRLIAERGGKNLANAVHALVAGLREGGFPIRPRDCDHCSFASICRISSRRLEEDDR